MTRRQIKNLAHSVHRRLQNKAKDTNRPFNELRQYFAMERFLYRLSESPHADKFVLKGALMFKAWEAPLSRPTMDIDLLGQTDNSVEAILAVTKDVCLQDVEPDGLAFDAASLQGERITEDADYEGVRVRFQASLGMERVPMQLDIGFGDVVVPSAVVTEYPTLLDLPAPRLNGYSRETAVAEKFEAMVKLGVLNSRLKDFFDIWLLSRQFDFDGSVLAMAITETFSTRGTEIPQHPVALTGALVEDPSKVAQWRGWIRKSKLENVPEDLGEVIGATAAFLGPIADALAAGRSFEGVWKAPGPWS